MFFYRQYEKNLHGTRNTSPRSVVLHTQGLYQNSKPFFYCCSKNVFYVFSAAGRDTKLKKLSYMQVGIQVIFRTDAAVDQEKTDSFPANPASDATFPGAT
jgi:hypothetical protein